MTFYILYVILNVKLTLHQILEGDIIKNIISGLRKERGITQQQLADMVNVTRQTIISLENGKYNPSITLAYEIAKSFGKTIEQVFIFEEK